MKNQKKYTTDNLEYFLTSILEIYRQIELELNHEENNQNRVQELIKELDTGSSPFYIGKRIINRIGRL